REDRDIETITVKMGETRHLVCREGDGGPPAARDDQERTGDDADEIIAIASRAIRTARALCPGGTFNNAKRYEAGDYVYQSDVDDIRWLISKSETMRSFLQMLPDEEAEIPFLHSMAAMGKATFLSGGSVCSQMSHLTLGLLTMLAPRNALIAVVYDGVID